MDLEKKAADIHALNPTLKPGLIREHLSRLGGHYSSRFTAAQISQHLELLSGLSAEFPVTLLLTGETGRSVECVILSFDYPFAFSFITGILASMGFNIANGDIFTYTGQPSGGQQRKIIDRFTGSLTPPVSLLSWKRELNRRLLEIFRILACNPDKPEVARKTVNRLVADRIREVKLEKIPVLFPMRIIVDNAHTHYTKMRIITQDTPFFLYALSNALAGQQILIEQILIRTENQRIEDIFYITDKLGRKIIDDTRLDRIKLSILLTKQFTYFLGGAPDSFASLSRFETLLVDILKLPEQGRWLELLSDPVVMQQLSRLLGASDFIWEDFIRLQYESLLPMFALHTGDKHFSQPAQSIPTRLARVLAEAPTPEEKKKQLNAFKDLEIYLIDLDYILTPTKDFRALSEHLTTLAEQIVTQAAQICFTELCKRFGAPHTVAGIAASYALFGLGKMGGAALGYASDIELLLIYSDQGRTDGQTSLMNSDFFSRLIRDSSRMITAKREGIFDIDLRLRPYGIDGPPAASLESFCKYYGRGGNAHALERLSLVRLRAIGGDPVFGALVEKLRDEIIYSSTHLINLPELHQARARQFASLARGNALNAKYSPGGLVDLEYDVQILQVMHGHEIPALRTPRLHLALEALAAAGVLEAEEKDYLEAAYYFFRKLINGLRMLRGTARDLYLPPPESEEYRHLARRTGYTQRGELKPARQLQVDLETNMAIVRTFVERHFGRESLPGPAIGNIADVIISTNPPQELKQSILTQTGFSNPERAYTNLMKLAGRGSQRENFIPLIILACTMLAEKPDADMALNNWERFIQALPDIPAHYRLLLSQPKRLDLLLDIFAHSQFLANILIRNPEFFDSVAIPQQLQHTKTKKMLSSRLMVFCPDGQSPEAQQAGIRIFKKQEILRIGIRDICLHAPITEVVSELSLLADVILQQALAQVCRTASEEWGISLQAETLPFCILAFGKLGGNELNYSSDIDLLGVFDEMDDQLLAELKSITAFQFYSRLLEQTAGGLNRHTAEGTVYRVDLRLRPFGQSGRLVGSLSDLQNYYRQQAALWEIQALLKLRPVAGNLAIGKQLVTELESLLSATYPAADIRGSIQKLRNRKISLNNKKILQGIDLKDGIGGIRDIEFLVQGLQLINLPAHPQLLINNTLQALESLAAAGILPLLTAKILQEDYVVLRRVEHFLQIFEDQQIHQLPADPVLLQSLAKKILGKTAMAADLMEYIEKRMLRVRGYYLQYLALE